MVQQSSQKKIQYLPRGFLQQIKQKRYFKRKSILSYEQSKKNLKHGKININFNIVLVFMLA